MLHLQLHTDKNNVKKITLRSLKSGRSKFVTWRGRQRITWYHCQPSIIGPEDTPLKATRSVIQTVSSWNT